MQCRRPAEHLQRAIARIVVEERSTPAQLVLTNALIERDDVPEAARLLSLEQHLWTDVAPVAIPLERLVDDGLLPMVEGRATRIKTLVDPWTATTRSTSMT